MMLHWTVSHREPKNDSVLALANASNRNGRRSGFSMTPPPSPEPAGASPSTVEDCRGLGVTDPGVWDLRVPDPGVVDRRDQGVEGPDEEKRCWALRPRELLSAD